MIKGNILLILVFCCSISAIESKLGIGIFLDEDYPIATLKCIVSQGITNKFIVLELSS
jgi:hypothetical protein